MSSGLEPRASVGVEAAEKSGVPGCAGFSESPSVNQLGPHGAVPGGWGGKRGRRGNGLEALTWIYSVAHLAFVSVDVKLP